MSEKTIEYDALLTNVFDTDTSVFDVNTSVFNTNKAVTGSTTRPSSPVLPDASTADITISTDTTYEMFNTTANNASTVTSITGKNFSYTATNSTTYNLVFRGWGQSGATTSSNPQLISGNNFNFTNTPVNIVFGQFTSSTSNNFYLAAGSTIQLTEFYNRSAITGDSYVMVQQNFVDNVVQMGEGSQFFLALDTGYYDSFKTSGALNRYNFTGNTFTFGANSNVDLSTGADTVFNLTGTPLPATYYADNKFTIGEDSTLTLGGSYKEATNNTINLSSGSTLSFQSNNSTDFNQTIAWSTGSPYSIINTTQGPAALQAINLWGDSNSINVDATATNVTVNVDAGFYIGVSSWNTGIDGTVNFSGTLKDTTVNVGDGSSFNFTGSVATSNGATFKLGKGSSLNIAEDVMWASAQTYQSNNNRIIDADIGTTLNSVDVADKKANSQFGMFSGTVDFSNGDLTSTLTIGNLSLTAGSIHTFIPKIQGIDENHGRILLENLNGFTIDTITFSNQSTAGSTTTNANAYVTINFKNAAGSTAVLYLKMDVQGELYFTPVTDSSGNIVSYYLSVCFAEGTSIQTIDGDKAVETLRRGDLVKTKNGIRAVSWVGHKTKEVNSLSKNEDFLVLIHKNALADNVPSKDLRVTAEHCLYVDGKLVPARMLVNGRSIIYDLETTSYTIWHVECAEHQIIFAENVAVESYLDTGNRYSFTGCDNVIPLDNKKETPVQYAAELCTSTDFVQPIWEQFNQRAIGLNFAEVASRYEEDNNPNIYLCTDDGQEIYPIDVQNQVYTFTVNNPTDFVSIMSYVSRPEEVFGNYVDDRRELGVAIGEIKIIAANGDETTIDQHLSSEKTVGWYDLEGDGANYRWTKGCAYLPLSVDSQEQYTLHIEVVSTLPKYLKKSVKYDFLYKKVS